MIGKLEPHKAPVEQYRWTPGSNKDEVLQVNAAGFMSIVNVETGETKRTVVSTARPEGGVIVSIQP